MKIPSLLCIALLILTSFYAQGEEYYFRIKINNIAQVDLLTRQISIDKLDGNYIYAYANEQQWLDINRTDYEIERLPHPSSLFKHQMAFTPGQITGWDTYPSYPLYRTMMRQYADSFPQICRLDTFGYTVQGRLMLVMKISDNVNSEEDEPEFFYTSTMHGDETAGYVLMLRLIDYLLHQYGQATPEGERVTRLLNNAEIWINPLANPDGTFRSDSMSVNTAWRYNANEVDLNRNFPDRITDPDNTPIGREPETAAMMQLAASHNFNLSANFHGGAQVVNYPWDNGAPSGSYSACPDDAWFIDVCLDYAATNPDMLNGGFPNGITNGCNWYAIFGGRQDWIYYWHGGRELTIELTNIKNPPGSMLPQRWVNNKESFLSYMEQIFTGLRGIVQDDETGDPLAAQIDVEGFAGVPVFTDPDVGDFHRMLLPGIYDVVISAPHYQADTLFNIAVLDTGATKLSVALQKSPNNIVAGNVVLADTNFYGGVRVQFENRTAITNRLGYFEFQEVFAGVLHLRFSKPGYATLDVDTTFDAQSPLLLNILMKPALYRVLLIDDDGGSRQGISVNNRFRQKSVHETEKVYTSGQSADLVETVLNTAGMEVSREFSSQTDTAAWQNYDMLFWSSGAETDPISGLSLQDGLMSFAQSGLPLIIEGGEIGYDFRNNPIFKDSVLHISNWVADDAGNLSVAVPSHPVTQNLPSTMPLIYSGFGDQDAVSPSSGTELLIYNAVHPTTAGVLLNGNDLFYAFNLAALNPADAGQLVFNSVNYFLPNTQPRHDLAVYRLDGISAGDMLTAGEDIILSVFIRNYGSSGEIQFPVNISITNENNHALLFRQTVQLDTLQPGEIAELHLGSWTVPDTLANLYVQASVGLAQDDRPGNNLQRYLITSLSREVGFAENFENSIDSLQWSIVSADSDSSANSWHLTYLPAMGRYSMRVNPDTASAFNQQEWLISPLLDNPTSLYFYWDYGSDTIQDSLLVVASHTDTQAGSFTDTLLTISGGYSGPVNHFEWLEEVGLNPGITYIAFLFSGQGGAYWAVDNIAFVSTTTALTDKPDFLPAKFELLPNFPNPFNPSTVIRYRLPVSTKVNISIFNTLGQKVLTMIDDKQAAGLHQIIWDGKNSAGESVASGIYFYRMETAEFTMSRKMLLVR